MKLRINIKKTVIAMLDIVLAAYLGLAMTSFNHPDEHEKMCTKININIADESTNGFLSAQEIKRLLEGRHLYPLGQQLQSVNPRDIEETLKESPFVSTAECYKTEEGHVCIEVTQRLPIVRIKNIKGEDYYVDDQGGIMSSTKYLSDLIIATGYVQESFARQYLAPLAQALMRNNFWKNQIEQINVLPDMGIELVPRVGDHIVFLGYLPQAKDKARREQLISDYAEKKLDRLVKFYKYGLSQAGWNRYHYINLEFDNQIICKRNDRTFPVPEQPKPVETTEQAAPAQPEDETIEENNASAEVQQPGTAQPQGQPRQTETEKNKTADVKAKQQPAKPAARQEKTEGKPPARTENKQAAPDKDKKKTQKQ